MQKIALYGGVFDPVHNGHIAVATAVRDAFSMDEVILIPANIPPHKATPGMAHGADRLQMLRLAIADAPRLSVSSFELERQETSYSYITAEHFAAVYPHAKLYFITGDEAYALIDTWKEPARIRAVADFIVVTREELPPPTDACYFAMPPVVVSSTEVRCRVQAKQPIDDLVCPAVAHYIREKNLYL